MSWYDKDWKYRAPFTLHNASTGTARDGTFTVPADMGKFWDNVQADLDDLRVTAADGRTVLTYDIASLNYSARTVTIRIDGYDWSAKGWGLANTAGTANTADSVVGGFFYWGNSAAADGAAANVSLSNAVTVGVELALPGSGNSPKLIGKSQSKSQTVPGNVIVKQSTETTRCWWDLSRLMLYRDRPVEDSRLLEEIAWVRVTVGQVDGNNIIDRTALMTTPAAITFSNFHTVQHELRAGASTATYLVTLLVGTDDGAGGTRVFDQRATLRVQDLAADSS
jgi:hypothetical protein